MNDQEHPVQITIAFDSEESAIAIGQELLQLRLVACIQLLPIKSMYWWKGGIQKDDEVLMYGKTNLDRMDEIESLVKKRHSYDVPEIIATPITRVHQPYLQWMKDSLNTES